MICNSSTRIPEEKSYLHWISYSWRLDTNHIESPRYQQFELVIAVTWPPFAIVHELSRLLQPLYQAAQEMRELSNKFQLKASIKNPDTEPPVRE